ncbi:MAG TPA: GTP-binding protein [Tepidisphaeraceae bacterium]|jgi:methylmalonyl-CoA mutase|nr:GTP-binding protein [Tepidisphaeraceae bacterium]
MRAKNSDSVIRLLTAVPICDGHDSAISTINLEFIRRGIEVIYLGYHRSARDIARAAVQEDVRAIGISSYNGGHVEFFAEVIDRLKEYGAADIGVFGGGGGTITRADERVMKRKGVSRIFFAGTPLDEMVDFVSEKWGGPAPTAAATRSHADHRLARLLTKTSLTKAALMGRKAGSKSNAPISRQRVIGVCGPGGAGKTTLIDELVLRFLNENAGMRIAVLSHDPSIVGAGALLGDRAAMLYCQSDRVFMRSLATSGRSGGLSPATERCLKILKENRVGGAFDVILVETVGIGQEAVPFVPGTVDQTVFVMSPEYGSRLQLQKIAMLDAADVIVVNKSDMAGAKTASSEVDRRLAMNHRDQRLVATVAKRHRDSGVNKLFQTLSSQ